MRSLVAFSWCRLALSLVSSAAWMGACTGDDDGGPTADGGSIDARSDPRPTNVIPDGACLMGFEATVRSGPSAGTSLVGLLALPVDAEGSLADAQLHTADGLHLPVTGRFDGGVVELTFELADGRMLRGTGQADEQLGACSGQLAGPLTGPNDDDRGDWLGDADATDRFTLPEDPLTKGSDYVAAASPTAHVVTLTQVSTGETVTVAGMPGMRSRRGLDTPSAVVYMPAPSFGIAERTPGLVISDTGNERIVLLALQREPASLAELFARPVDLVTQSSLAALSPAPTVFRPRGLSVDRLGQLIFADQANHVVIQTDPARTFLVIAGAVGEPGATDGPRGTSRLTGPAALRPHARNRELLIVERPSCRTRYLSPRSVLSTVEEDTSEGCDRPVSIGMPCDPLMIDDVCERSAACATVGGRSRCVALGSLDAPCLPAGSEQLCDPTLFCIAGICRAPIADGAACVLPPTDEPPSTSDIPCATGSTCLSEGTSSVCRRDGADGGMCRPSSPTCDGTLACGSGRCVTSIAVGGICTPGSGSPCVAGSTCELESAFPVRYACMVRGTLLSLCRSGAGTTPCDAGLGCGADGYCRRAYALGGECDPSGICSAASSCRAVDNGIQRCIADGARGGSCRFATPSCDAGNTCVGVGTGGVCFATSGTRGVGSACNMELPCDSGLACASASPIGTVGFGGFCQQILAPGAICDPRSIFNVCPAGQGCRPTGYGTGVCAAPVAEVEPNSIFTPPLPLGTSTSQVFSGSLTVTSPTGAPASDADCFAATVPAGGAISLSARYVGARSCTGMTITVGSPPFSSTIYFNQAFAFDPLRQVCPWANGFEPMLTGLPAGTYSVCVGVTASFSGSADYLLSVGIHMP